MLHKGGLLHQKRIWNVSRTPVYQWIAVFPSVVVAVVRCQVDLYPMDADPGLEMGHTIRGCSEEALEVDRVGVKCVNCDENGHRARDCPEPRKDKFACRNCKYVGTSPRSISCTDTLQAIRPPSLGVY